MFSSGHHRLLGALATPPAPEAPECPLGALAPTMQTSPLSLSPSSHVSFWKLPATLAQVCAHLLHHMEAPAEPGPGPVCCSLHARPMAGTTNL